jgi:hypothetical protein
MLRSSERKPVRPTKAAVSSQRGRAKKVSLTVDEGVLRAMEREAKRSKRTLSAEVTEALARELRRRRLQALVAEYEQEKGTISAQELAVIQAEWLA